MKKMFVEREKDDDVLDALSLWINKILKTEKKGKDKKNNVYFWLFKFVLLIIYLHLLSSIFDALIEGGIALVYYYAISLRSILALIYIFVASLAKSILILYILFKNLNIFINSTYYKRLYSSDKEMLKKKDKLFKTARILLQVGSFMPLMALGFSASIILILSVLLITLFVNSGAYSIGISLMLIVLFLICFFLFKEIYNKFFGKKVMNNRNLFVCLFISLIVSILIFGYETNSYEVSESLPFSFKMNNKELYFDIDNFKDIVVNSNSKYDNIKVYEEDLETGKMKIVLTYFNTSKPFYKNILKEDDKLYLEFDSTFIPNLDTPDSILRLGTDTIKNKTIYNYNMLKYPEISIYVNSDDMKKLEINKGL